VPHGARLRRLATALVVARDDLVAARADCLLALGPTATAQAISVIAAFDGINRVADATGISVDTETYQRFGRDVVRDLDLRSMQGDRT
jgi:hypothetical protein